MKNKKLLILILFLVSLFALFIYLFNKEHSYEYIYEVSDYSIIEKYDSEKKYFAFDVNEEFYFSIIADYSNKRGLIEEISIVDDCLTIVGELEFFDFCKNEDIYYFDNLEENENYFDSYDKIEIYDLNNYSYFIWNYHGFVYISEDEVFEIDLFESDVYYPSLIKQVDNYLFVPNYDEDYYFSSYFLINMKDGSYKEIKLDTDINFDIYYISSDNNELSIYDKKNSKVYEIKLTKGIDNIKNQVVYSDSEINEFSTISNEYFLLEDSTLYYKLDDFKVYLSDYEVNEVFFEDSSQVLFLSGSKLFSYTIGGSVDLVLQYSEWDFNYLNQIFVY